MHKMSIDFLYTIPKLATIRFIVLTSLPETGNILTEVVIMYRFKDVRLAKGFSSMKDFAKFLGIPYTTYINYEKANENLSLNLLMTFVIGLAYQSTI